MMNIVTEGICNDLLAVQLEKINMAESLKSIE